MGGSMLDKLYQSKDKSSYEASANILSCPRL